MKHPDTPEENRMNSPDAPPEEIPFTDNVDGTDAAVVPASWLDEAHEESRTLRNKLNRREKTIERLRKRCDEGFEENEQLIQELAQTQAQYADVSRRLDTAEIRLQAIEGSTSWRVLGMIRWLFDSVKRCIGKCIMRLWRARAGLEEDDSAPEAPKRDLLEDLWKAFREERQRPHACLPAITEHVSPDGACAVPAHGRRLLIYAFQDAYGIVDEYVLHFLRTMLPWVEKILVVSSEALCPEGEQALHELGCEVLRHESRGLSAHSFKTGLEHIGFDALPAYDEVIFADDSFFGPVYDLKELFEPMSARKADFWGISTCPETREILPGTVPEQTVPVRMCTFFYAIRKRLLTSQAFRQLWTQLPELTDTNCAAGQYALEMAEYFSNAGYCKTCVMDPQDYTALTDDPLITMPRESIRDWGSPFILREAFFADFDYLTATTGQQPAVCLQQYLQESKSYDMDLIWPNLIRTCHMSDLSKDMSLLRVFSQDEAVTKTASVRSALFMHLYDPSMAEEMAHYAGNLPPETDIFISTVSDDRKQQIEAVFSKLPNRVEIRVLPNRGRDVSALLTSFCDVVGNYDVACVTHDKKVPYLKPQTVGEGFKYVGYENILASRSFVEQVLCAFEKEKYLGLLCAPDPKFADFVPRAGALEWGANFANTKALAEELGLKVPMDESHPPMAPIGSSFWFRTKAMAPLFAKNWTYADFPEEPFDMKDGSILHAIERIYPYTAQQAGYYSALLMTADFAAIDIGNLRYFVRGYAEVCFGTQIMSPFTLANVRAYCEKLMPEQEQTEQDLASKRKEPIPAFKNRFAQNLWGLLSDWEKL